MAQSSAFERVVFEPNEAIFTEGRPADAVYLIVEGKVEIRTGNFGDSPRRLAVCGKGDVIGEMAIFEKRPHAASALALTRTAALTMSRLEFLRRVEKLDPIMKGIIRLMVGRLRQLAVEPKAPNAHVGIIDWHIKKRAR